MFLAVNIFTPQFMYITFCNSLPASRETPSEGLCDTALCRGQLVTGVSKGAVTSFFTFNQPRNPSKQWRTQEFCWGGGQQIQLRTEDRENGEGSGGGSPLVRGSGGSCNLVQEISFHIVKFS